MSWLKRAWNLLQFVFTLVFTGAGIPVAWHQRASGIRDRNALAANAHAAIIRMLDNCDST